MPQSISTKIKELLTHLHEGLYEKEEVMRLTLLSALAGESIFLLGKPGVAKSLLARRLKFAFAGAKAFEYLMSRFSTPDEIFGPVSISKLKDEDKYERVTRNYLPEADIVFLDEIWKAGPSIQNALLTIINEKIYKNGEHEIKANIKLIISASNELPAENEGLEALWDRFLIRYVVQSIENPDAFNAMIGSTASPYEDNIPTALKISNKEYTNWSKNIDTVEVPDEVFQVIQSIRTAMNDYNKNNQTHLYISDRRWRKIVRILRTSAFFNGRSKVDLMDCFLMIHCLWDHPKDSNLMSEIVVQAIKQQGFILKGAYKALNQKIQNLSQDIENKTIITAEVETEELKLVEGRFFQFTANGIVYKIDEMDYHRLQTVPSVISFFFNRGGQWGQEETRRRAFRSKIEHHIGFYDESAQIREYKMDTHWVKKYKKVQASPEEQTQKEWDSRIEALFEECRAIKTEIKNYLQQRLFADNLFADNSLNYLLENNIEQQLKDMEQMDMDIKEVAYRYRAISR